MSETVPLCATDLPRFTGSRGGGMMSAASTIERIAARIGGCDAGDEALDPGACGQVSQGVDATPQSTASNEGEKVEVDSSQLLDTTESSQPLPHPPTSSHILPDGSQQVLELRETAEPSDNISTECRCMVSETKNQQLEQSPPYIGMVECIAAVPSAAPVQRPPWPTQKGYPKGPGTVLHDAWAGRGLSRGARELMALLVRVSRGLETCNPRQRWLAAKLESSSRSVTRWTQELVEKGLIWIKRRYRSASLYFLRSTAKPVEKPVDKENISTGPSDTLSDPLMPVSLVGFSNLKTFDSAELINPTQPQTKTQPPRKPPAYGQLLESEDIDLLRRGLLQFQPWIKVQLEADTKIMRAAIRIITRCEIPTEVAVSRLYNRYKLCIEKADLRPRSWGWVKAVLEELARWVTTKREARELREAASA